MRRGKRAVSPDQVQLFGRPEGPPPAVVPIPMVSSSPRFGSVRPFLEWTPDQAELLPERVRDVLGERHLACFVVDLHRVLDFGSILSAYPSHFGRPAYHPVMMTLLLIYAYAQKVTSSREIARLCATDIGFRYVSGGAQPDHDTICTFRVKHGSEFRGLFRQTLELAAEAGILKVGHISVDGSKIRANASKHKAMSYGRMDESTIKLDEQIEKLLTEADRIDAEEDRRYGKGRRGDELPEEFSDPKVRLERLKEARHRIEARKKRELAAEKEKRRDKIQEAKETLEDRARLKAHSQGKPAQDAKPDPKAQMNFTDPESRIMPKGHGTFEQAYNAQVAVDAESQIIVAEEVIQSTTDANQLTPMVEQTIANTGMVPRELSADSGYLDEDDVQEVEGYGVECFVATRRQRHGEDPMGLPRGRVPLHLTFKERMRRKLLTRRGRLAYAKRKVTAEPVFGQIKNRGFRRFSMRGLLKVNDEFSFVCAVHNLLKLFTRGWWATAEA
jgi:transposase